MYRVSLITASVIATLASGAVALYPHKSIDINSPRAIFSRQDNVNSTCNVFGIDFQDGGSYFINSLSNVDFTIVSKFEGCNNDTASILLVNDQTEDEYECTSVPTVPDDVPELSTCPIEKSQMSTGNWSILSLGNNGDGNPFAYQRDFFLTVEPQQTVTITPTVTYTLTTTPTVTVTNISTITDLSTISNNKTVTVPAETDYTTVTPPPVTVTSTYYHTRTFWSWTKTQTKITDTVTATCTVPPRPGFPDGICRHRPTAIPIPPGVKFAEKRAARPVDVDYVRKRFENHRAAKARAELEVEEKRAIEAEQKRAIEARSADPPTVTSTATQAVNFTTTATAPATTVSDFELTTSTIYSTLPPATVKSGDEVDTITATPSTTVITVQSWTVTYITRTMDLTWTLTTTVTPTASVTACKSQGGHFGNGWGAGGYN